MTEKIKALAQSLLDNGICANMQEAEEKAKDLLAMTEKVQGLQKDESHREHDLALIRQELEVLKDTLETKETEIKELRKDKEDLDSIRKQLEKRIVELQQ